MGTMAAVAAGAFALSTGIAQADPDDARAQQEELEEELATLTEDYNLALEDHEAAESRLETIEGELSDVEDILDSKSDQVRNIATAAYAGANYEGMHLFFDGDPDEALSGSADLSYLSENNNNTLADYLAERQRLDTLRDEAVETEEEAAAALAEAEDRMTEGEEAVAELEDVLAEEETDSASSSSSSSASSESSESSGGSSASSGGGSDSSSDPAPSSNAQGAAAAIEFARAQIGKPYVWGGTGPDGFDCSGLTLRAWEQGGVTLPRVSQDQWNFGTRVDRSDIQPGDLLFFYDSSAPTHVGLYSGDGKMIHGSNPAKPIEEVNLADYWDGVYVGAIRPN
ncbi:C40 family peptidase [Spiractinospora alimapuensis]|nr:C40 family peptidase [Spiractinospora alimapuensis]